MSGTQFATPTTTPSVTEILTIDDLALFLKMPRQSVYEMTRKRGQVRHANPLPVCRIGGHIRFRMADIEQWLASSVQKSRKQ